MATRATFIEAYQRKARESLAEARTCLAHQAHQAAVSRAYYALYQATNAWMVHAARLERYAPDHPNARHEDIERRWPLILREVRAHAGVRADLDGHKLYGRLKHLRVRVDYKVSGAPTLKDTKVAVWDAERAVGWLLQALMREGR